MLDIEKTKQEIVHQLTTVDATKVILFGSYAYGTPNEDSDLDICIVKEKIISKIKEKREIRELLKGIKIPKDILVVDENYYQTHSDENWINTALYDVKNRGVVLYEKR
jgi:predicted nucleotidyltransferase